MTSLNFSLSLETEIAGIKLRNPFGLASSSLGSNARILKSFADIGLGFVTTKSITKKERWGYQGNRIIHLDKGLINAEGLPNVGIDKFEEEITLYKSFWDNPKDYVPIFASVIGFNKEELLEVATRLADKGSDAIEINFSCPHEDPTKPYVKGLIGQHHELVREFTELVKKNIKQPVLAKLTPNVTDIIEIAKAAEEGKADALVISNTYGGAMDIDENGKPILSNIFGGISGENEFFQNVGRVYFISKEVKIPIIATTGIGLVKNSSVKYIQAGATALGMCSAFYKKNRELIMKELLQELTEFMNNHNYNSLDQFRGISHKYVKIFDEKGILLGNIHIDEVKKSGYKEIKIGEKIIGYKKID